MSCPTSLTTKQNELNIKTVQNLICKWSSIQNKFTVGILEIETCGKLNYLFDKRKIKITLFHGLNIVDFQL